jgi:hypothetical protein
MAGGFAILTRPLGAWSEVPASHPRVLQDPADRNRRNQFGGDYFNDPLFNPGSLILNTTITAVPELSTWIMTIAGFAGISVVGSARAAKWRLLPTLGRRMRA